MKLRDARQGVILKVKQRPITYSRHPVVKGDRRFGLQNRIFATNPWSVIRGAIHEMDDANTKSQAASFIEQAEDFYRAYQSAHETASKPLLVYYAMLNLVKAFVLKQGIKASYDKAQHGLQEGVHLNGIEFDNTFLKAFKSKPGNVNIFDDFMEAFCGKKLPTNEKVFDLKNIHPQILQGHRLWADAYSQTERFVEIERVDFVHNQAEKKIWLVKPVHQLGPLIEAVSEFAARAAEKLRKQNCLATELLVFMHTSLYRPGPQCSRSVVVPLRRPTDDTLALAKAATDGMRFMYVAGYQFIKAGVILVDLQSASVQQRELDLGDPNEPPATRDRSRLMAAMDVINTRFGKGTVHSGGTGKPGTNRVWTMKQERRTPAYTTCLADVPVARA